jgi:hypothetical protein
VCERWLDTEMSGLQEAEMARLQEELAANEAREAKGELSGWRRRRRWRGYRKSWRRMKRVKLKGELSGWRRRRRWRGYRKSWRRMKRVKLKGELSGWRR